LFPAFSTAGGGEFDMKAIPHWERTGNSAAAAAAARERGLGGDGRDAAGGGQPEKGEDQHFAQDHPAKNETI